jgi:hypothetical protein
VAGLRVPLLAAVARRCGRGATRQRNLTIRASPVAKHARRRMARDILELGCSPSILEWPALKLPAAPRSAAGFFRKARGASWHWGHTSAVICVMMDCETHGVGCSMPGSSPWWP